MNHQLAIIGQNYIVSWFAIFSFIGCLAGFLTACILRRTQNRYVSDVFIVMTFGVPLGLIFGRVFYCLFAASEYNSIWQMVQLSVGGYGLFGAMFGVFLAAVLTKKMFGVQGWGELLDCLAIGGALAVAVGRFASYFSGVEIGYEVPFDVLTIYIPEDDLHVLAVYWLDGIYEAVVWLICLFFYRYVRRKGEKERSGGLTALLMLALHGTNAVIMESMRSDALKLGANDFIKVSQILGITCCVAVTVTFLALTVKRSGFHWKDVFFLLAIIVCVVLGVIAEWRVGKGDYIRKHLLMLASMAALGAIAIRYGVKASLPSKTEKEAAPEKQSLKGSRRQQSRKRRISHGEAEHIIAAFKDSAGNEI